MLITEEMVDDGAVLRVHLAGRGGRERQLSQLFKNARRTNEPLADFEVCGVRCEVKTQRNTQWFDLGKYHDLSDEQKCINMVFVLHRDGKVEAIIVITLGSFLALMMDDPEGVRDG